MLRILLTRPNHDQITTYISQWSSLIIDFARSKGCDILDLEGKKANRKTFEKYLLSNKPKFILLNGHGSSDVICGHNDEVLIDSSSGAELIAKTIIYARSCNSGEALGGILVGKGTLSFIGYVKPFTIAMENKYSSRPKDDPLAKMFLEPSNLVATTIIKGNTVYEAHHRSILAMKNSLSDMISSNKKDYAFALYNNMISQVLIGDPEAKLSL